MVNKYSRCKLIVLIGSIFMLASCNNFDLDLANLVKKQSKQPPVEQNVDKHKDTAEQPESTASQEKDLPTLDGTTKLVDGKLIVTNVDDILVLVNKKRNLPADYVPKNLVVPNVPFPFEDDVPKKQLQQVAATAVEKLFAAAKNEGLHLYGQSGYRSYDRQQSIYAYNVQTQGEEEASKVSAHPGQSEHQTGLALDVTTPEVKLDLVTEFGETKEGIWLKNNAAKYGFIIRYPKEKVAVTGYTYEPWHIRYVGVDVATEIMSKRITLEEYFQQ